MKLLRHQQAVQAEWRLRAGAAWQDSGLVFTNKLGGHLMPHTVYQNYKKVVASIGRPDARFHDLRHSYAVAAIRGGDTSRPSRATWATPPPPLPWMSTATSPTR